MPHPANRMTTCAWHALLTAIVLLVAVPQSHAQIIRDSDEQKRMRKARAAEVQAIKQERQQARARVMIEYTTIVFGYNEQKRAQGEDVSASLRIKIVATNVDGAVSCLERVIGKEIFGMRTRSYFWWMLDLEEYLSVTQCSDVEYAVYDPSSDQLEGE